MQFLSKTIWYQKFQFLTWQLNLFRTSKVKPKLGVNSLQKLLGTVWGFSKLDLVVSSKVLVVAQVLCQQRSYTYLNTQNKFTILKPKFNLIFPLKSVLLLRYHLNTISLDTSKVKHLITQLSCLSLKRIYRGYPDKKYLTTIFYRKFKPLVLTKRFFLVRIFLRFLSTFQQKINFFQFKFFLKKLL